jgi:predicted esterase
MKESAIYLLSLIQQENEILATEGAREGDGKVKGQGKVGLLGFSQGCAMGILMVLSGVLDPLVPHVGVKVGEEREPGMVRASLGTSGVTPFIGMSGWLPFRAQIENVLDQKRHPREYIRTLLDLDSAPSPAGSVQDILLAHGADDVKVKLEWALQLREIVPRILGPEARVTSNIFDGLAHCWNEEELICLILSLKEVWNLE